MRRGKLATRLLLVAGLGCLAAQAQEPAGTPVPQQPPAPEQSGQASLERTNEYLLSRVQQSGLTFVRNDNKYDGASAAEHIRRKYDYFRERIHTPEDFIELTASRSLVSGRDYLVILPDGTTLPLRQWLLDELAAYRGTPDRQQRTGEGGPADRH